MRRTDTWLKRRERARALFFLEVDRLAEVLFAAGVFAEGFFAVVFFLAAEVVVLEVDDEAS